MYRTGRRPRIHEPHTIHHVMMRGNNRQTIFFGRAYFEQFLTIVEESAEKYDHKILSYCLMNNHIHLVVYVHETPLSIILQNINFRLSKIAEKFQRTQATLARQVTRVIHDEPELFSILTSAIEKDINVEVKKRQKG